MPLRFGGAAFFCSRKGNSYFQIWRRGGIDSLRSPCGQPTHCVRGLSNCLRQLPNPGRGFSSPLVCNMRKKSSHFRTSSFLNMAVRGGLTRFARPAGSPLTAFVVCPTGCASCRTPVGASHPPGVQYAKKKLALSYGLFLKYGGEGGIRTPDTLPYTHFPGVLLQPLGHLTKFSLQHRWNGR